MMLFAPRAAYDAGPFVTTHVRCVGRLMLTIASAAPKGLFSTIAPGVTVYLLEHLDRATASIIGGGQRACGTLYFKRLPAKAGV